MFVACKGSKYDSEGNIKRQKMLQSRDVKGFVVRQKEASVCAENSKFYHSFFGFVSPLLGSGHIHPWI